MIRKAFRMSVSPDRHAEYERRHRPIWKELEDALLDHGVGTYSIYLDPETSDLFGYAEIESEERWAAVASTDVCRRWWRHMRELMPSNPDDSPVSRELREVFHIERAAGARP
ncbi:MAG: L-rhamnose mutarotase [Vicinamibacteria bacterium]